MTNVWVPTLFVSFSNHDSSFVQDVGQGVPFFLRVLKRIRGGQCRVFISSFESDQWRPEVAQTLAVTDVFIPVMSDDFLGSESCETETRQILERRAAGEPVATLPFLYRYCVYDHLDWMNDAVVWRGPGQFYNNEASDFHREHSVISFRSRIEQTLAAMEQARS